MHVLITNQHIEPLSLCEKHISLIISPSIWSTPSLVLSLSPSSRIDGKHKAPPCLPSALACIETRPTVQHPHRFTIAT
jgi:hypothetical protein